MSDPTALHADTKSILEQARGQARSAVNTVMVEAYWRIGQRIVEEEQQGESRVQYGQRLLENLSRELSASFGNGASLAASQSRNSNINHLHLRLLFYSYLPQCFVILDLKSGEDDNPTIGIILCDGMDETIVKRSVLKESRQLFASKHKRVLPTEAELAAEIEREKRSIEGLE